MGCKSLLQDNVTVGPSEPATVGGIVPPIKLCTRACADWDVAA
jgi:hypothetical protein